MPTQKEIAEHLGLDQSAVSRHMGELGIDWRNEPLSKIRLRYIDHLRGIAAGHRSQDGMDLTRERALTEQVDRELKQITLAEKRGQVINIAQLEPELSRMVGAFKAELISRDDKLKAELDALYGIDIDLSLLTDHTLAALAQLARYDIGGAPADQALGAAADAARAPDDNPVGAPVQAPVPEGHGPAGRLQP